MNTNDAGKIKLSFDEPQFYVNKNKRTVACKIRAYVSIPTELYRILNIDTINIETVGVSYCHKDDVWDEAIGRHIAESKAKRQAFQISRRSTVKLLKRIVPVVKSIVNFEENMCRYAEYETKHIEDLSNLTE